MIPSEPAPIPPPLHPAPARSLRTNRRFGLYLAGTTASWAGLGIADVLLIWLVYNETGSTAAVTAVGVAEALPPMIVGFMAGVLADRYNRPLVLMVTAGLQAAVIGLVPVTLELVGFQLGTVLALVLALESVTVIFRPASTALLPDLVDSPALDEANALTQGFTSVASTAGAAGAAALLIVLGMIGSLEVNFVVFLVGAASLALIVGVHGPARAAVTPPVPRPLGRDLRDILGFLRQHEWLAPLTLISVAAGFFITMFSPFLVIYAVVALDQPSNIFGYLIGAYSAGFFAGSLLTPRLGIVRHYGLFLVVALLASGGALALLVLVPLLVPALVALAGLGLLMGLLLTAFVTLVQRTVPSELLGRYLGLEESLSWGIAPLGIVVGGILTLEVGIRTTYLIAAAGLMGVGVLALASGRIRRVRYTLPTVEEPAVGAAAAVP
jgi:MFS family permease